MKTRFTKEEHKNRIKKYQKMLDDNNIPYKWVDKTDKVISREEYLKLLQEIFHPHMYY